METERPALLDFLRRDPISNFEILFHLQHEEARFFFQEPSYLIELPSARKVFLNGEEEVALSFISELSHSSYLIQTSYDFLAPLKRLFIVREVEMYLIFALKEKGDFIPYPDARVRPLIPKGSPIFYEVGKDKISLQTFYGIFLGEKLASYGGTQFETDEYAEIAWLYTEPQYRGKGYGLKVVSAIVNDLLKEGKTPIYRVSATNIASRRLAEKLGFQLYSRFFYVSVKLRP